MDKKDSNNLLMGQLFAQEELKSECFANNIRFIFTGIYFLVAFAIQNEIPARSFNAILLLSTINLLYALFIHFELKKAVPFKWITFPSVSFDVLLLSLVIYSFGSFRSFKSEAFMLYYLLIGLSVVRFSPRITLTAGLLSIASSVAMALFAVHTESIQLGTITEGFTTEKVSISSTVLRILFLTLFVATATYIAYVFRKIAGQAVQHNALQKQNDKLHITLNKLRQAQKQLAVKNRELATLSEIDSLTQIYNRGKIDNIMEEAMFEAKQEQSPLSIILLDIDLFKSFNDRFGHLVGDRIIKHMASLLTSSARGNDTIGRWGGEEFLIVCRQTDTQAAEIVAERLRKKIQQNKFITGEKITCSFGISSLSNNDNPDALLKRTDDALYESKHNGRNQITINLFSSSDQPVDTWYQKQSDEGREEQA